MKHICTLLLLFVVSFSFSQLKKKFQGYYIGNSEQFSLFSSSDNESDVVVSNTSVQLFFHKDSCVISMGETKFSGRYTIHDVTKGETKISLVFPSIGEFVTLLNTKEKFLVFIGRDAQSSFILEKQKRKKK